MPLQPNNKNNNKQTPSPATLRNPYVKSHNIQSSFLSLTTETAQYREATQQATKERQALQERLQTCRHEIQTSAEEIRAAQDTLGGATREISLWRRQETNVRDKLLRERQVLEELTHTIQELEGTVKYDRCDFCRNMADLNHELGRLLRAHEEARLASFMHPETAATVLMTDENTGGVEEEGGDATPHNNGPDDSPARDEHRDLQAALAALHEAAGVYEDFRAQEENYSQHVVDLRRRILAEGKRTATAAAASRDKFVADGDEVRVGW
jgi:small-conductance mechanosensitive channel